MNPIQTNEDNIRYKNNYLESVIVRIDFVKKIDALTNSFSPKVQKKIMKHFPIAAPGKMFFRSMEFSTIETKTQSENGIDWKFFGEDREKLLSITSTWMFIEVKKYKGFASLKKDFTDCFKALLTEYPDIQINRLGLRYINDIKFPSGDPFNWADYINDFTENTRV
jgi:uncharacterized protein (TIGR04255 family)